MRARNISLSPQQTLLASHAKKDMRSRQRVPGHFHYFYYWDSKQSHINHLIRAAKVQSTGQGLKHKSSHHAFPILSLSSSQYFYLPALCFPLSFLWQPLPFTANNHLSSQPLQTRCLFQKAQSRGSCPWMHTLQLGFSDAQRSAYCTTAVCNIWSSQSASSCSTKNISKRGMQM